jgi:hypothetical protein
MVTLFFDFWATALTTIILWAGQFHFHSTYWLISHNEILYRNAWLFLAANS